MTSSPSTPDHDRLIGFPDPVDEVSARLVAAGVVAMALTCVLLDWRWLTGLLAYGFVARVLTGSKASPLGRLVTGVIRPRLSIAPRFVPGPPKRFAQGVGAIVSLTALVLTATGRWDAARIVLLALAAVASLEAALGLCLGCKAFAALMRLGLVPEAVCERCAAFDPAQRSSPV